MQYLGHAISEEGITVHIEKIVASMEWPIEKMLDMAYFMGLVGYYRMFIKGFFKITHLITSLEIKKFEIYLV